MAGPFTVEADTTRVYDSPEFAGRSKRQKVHDASWGERVLTRLEAGGVQGSNGEQWDLTSTEPVADEGEAVGRVSHTGTLESRKSGVRRRAILCIWPDDVTVDQQAVHWNVQEARRHGEAKEHVLIVAGAAFAPGLPSGKGSWAYEVLLAKAKADLITTQAKRNLSSRSGIGGVRSAT